MPAGDADADDYRRDALVTVAPDRPVQERPAHEVVRRALPPVTESTDGSSAAQSVE